MPGGSPGYGRLLLNTDGRLYGTTIGAGRTVAGAPAGGRPDLSSARKRADALAGVETVASRRRQCPRRRRSRWRRHLDFRRVRPLPLLPENPDAASAPQPTLSIYPEGQRLRIVFTRDPARNDVTVEVQGAFFPQGPGRLSPPVCRWSGQRTRLRERRRRRDGSQNSRSARHREYRPMLRSGFCACG